MVTATEGWEVCFGQVDCLWWCTVFDFKTHVFNPARGALECLPVFFVSGTQDAVAVREERLDRLYRAVLLGGGR